MLRSNVALVATPVIDPSIAIPLTIAIFIALIVIATGVNPGLDWSLTALEGKSRWNRSSLLGEGVLEVASNESIATRSVIGVTSVGVETPATTTAGLLSTPAGHGELF